MKIFKKKETLKKMETLMYPVIQAPFCGGLVPVMLRELTEAQIRSCGDFSLIETFENKLQKKVNKFRMKEMIAYSERMHNVAEAALYSPTYSEVLGIVKQDERTKSIEAQIKDIEALIVKAPKGKELTALQETLNNKKVHVNLLLPVDFLSFIVSYTLGIAKSDIKAVSEDMLLRAAILATKGHDNPADHIDGRFTPFMVTDINERAWSIFEDFKKNGSRKGI